MGVFDTVAALGNPATFTLFSLVALLGAALTPGVVQALVGCGMFDGVLAHLTFWNVFIGIVITAVLAALVVYVYTHLKWDFKVEGYGWRDRFKTIQFNELWMQFYDTELHPNVEYARHAISISRRTSGAVPDSTAQSSRPFVAGN
jgi:Uncharacterized alpha/beta hydrolase domain (DUF2235)